MALEHLPEDSYLTLKRESEGVYKEKGSKFLAFAFPIKDENDIREHLEQLRKNYYDARHHCYAYILGKNQDLYRANDDGEPNHSAGDPILGQIRSNGLTNVMIVVVRYFGGTKLGVSGLINAYKTAAAEAIANNEIITAILHDKVKIDFEYLNMNEVMKLIKEYDLQILEQHFDNQCQLVVEVRQKHLEEITLKISDLNRVKIHIL
ncbi:YigZ family protein [Cecembia lonarensis]|uniref:IMPACT family member yigZ n=1 Tax=Cecembia lonarensis (strain CCUG 58316 / KCTC 22772 / LW9) TaxID=1225176 RepID=K1LZL2_CECL9|nr:YigZ family protein [Cecembia lonarensis]EKB49549.1 IMPACT family member yigZ [Cecembia lonarensis LW9]